MSWDEGGQSHAFGARRSGRSELEPDRLPEVRELAELGWELAPEAPMWVFLPYVWPTVARAWVPDRSTRWEVDTVLDSDGRVTAVECRPLSEGELAVQEQDTVADLESAGIPPRPRGRLWLLRPVGRFGDLDGLLDHLCHVAEERGVETRLSAAFTALCAGELGQLSGQSGSLAR